LVELVHSVFDPFGKYTKEASRFDEDRMKKIQDIQYNHR
jgi:hypothetical protein